MRKLIYIIVCIVLATMTASCYEYGGDGHDTLVYLETQSANITPDSSTTQRYQDSLTFSSTHHYSKNYNFVIQCDSLVLYLQQPEEIVSGYDAPKEYRIERDIDSVTVYRGEHLVVADIRILPTDSVDSVWVQVARDQFTIGWRHERELLSAVVPSDPISQFISVFSNTHILWTLIVVGMIIVIYTLRLIHKRHAHIIHLDDIASFYPTLLVITLALAATLYSSIQLFEPDMWRHYYFHPTLNPFSLPPLLGIFIAIVWMLPILGIATVEDVLHHLPFADALLYLSGLTAVCMVIYTVFSVLTLYYVGYPLLAGYIYVSVWTFFRNRRLVYYCGRCGKAIHEKGVCPYCGARNI